MFGKKECKWESTFERGTGKFNLFMLLLVLRGGIFQARSVVGISKDLALIALWRIWSLALARRVSRRGQSRRFRFFSVFPWTRAWLPVTNLALRRWTNSNSSLWLAWWGSQTQHPYSSTGLTRVLIHFSLTSMGQKLMLRCRNASVPLAFPHTAEICSDQFSFESIMTPRYLADLTIVKSVSWME